jgi:hypothetical protein
VDPLAGQFPHQSPYVFTDNNPIMLVDPDGRSTESWDDILTRADAFFKSVDKKINGQSPINEAVGIMRQIRQGSGNSNSPITDYVNFESFSKTEGVERKQSQHSDFLVYQPTKDSPKLIVGHDNTELVNTVQIYNESNLGISYDRKENRVKYHNTNGKPLNGIIRIVIPAWDNLAKGLRTTGIQLVFDVGNESQLKSFLEINKNLGGLPVKAHYNKK